MYGAGTVDLELNYVTGGPGDWSIPTTITDTEPRHTELGFDADGNLAAAWADSSDRTINYVYHDGTAWQTPEEVASGARVRSGASLLLTDTVEEAGILHAERWMGTPIHMQRSSDGTWSAGSGDGLDGSENAEWLSATLNNAGNPVMAYIDASTGDLVYAEWDGDEWSTEIALDLPTLGTFLDRSYIDIAVDDWGHTHLLYYNPHSDQVEYRYRHVEGFWGGARALHQQANASWMRLAIDDAQRPWFSYMVDIDDEVSLYYGHGAAVPEPATTALFAIGILSVIGLKRRNSKTSSRGQS